MPTTEHTGTQGRAKRPHAKRLGLPDGDKTRSILCVLGVLWGEVVGRIAFICRAARRRLAVPGHRKTGRTRQQAVGE